MSGKGGEHTEWQWSLWGHMESSVEMIGNLTSDNIQVLLGLYNTLGMASVYKLHVLAQYFSFTMTL